MTSPEEMIEKALGRKLNPAREGSVDYLNQLPSELLAEARSMARESKMLAYSFIQFYYRPGHLGEVKAFIEDVVVGNQEPAQWQRWNRLYAPAVLLPQLLRLSAEEVLAPLQDTPGERWVRLVPVPSSRTWSSFHGRPAILHRSSDEEWRPPENVSTLVLSGHETLETLDDVTLGIRRWIASCVARDLRRTQLELGPGVDVGDVASVIAAGVSLSADAEIAIRALLREERELGPSSDAVPGFRGPDAWYAA